MLVISQQSLYYLFFKHFGILHVHVLRLLTLVEMGLRTALWSAMIALPARRQEARQRLLAYALIFRKTVAERSYYHPCEEKGVSGTTDE